MGDGGIDGGMLGGVVGGLTGVIAGLLGGMGLVCVGPDPPLVTGEPTEGAPPPPGVPLGEAMGEGTVVVPVVLLGSVLEAPWTFSPEASSDEQAAQINDNPRAESPGTTEKRKERSMGAGSHGFARKACVSCGARAEARSHSRMGRSFALCSSVLAVSRKTVIDTENAGHLETFRPMGNCAAQVREPRASGGPARTPGPARGQAR